MFIIIFGGIKMKKYFVFHLIILCLFLYTTNSQAKEQVHHADSVPTYVEPAKIEEEKETTQEYATGLILLEYLKNPFFNHNDKILVDYRKTGLPTIKRILQFMNRVANKIENRLMGKQTQEEREKVIHYQQSKYVFDLTNGIFLGDCSWWTSMVIKNTFPNFYEKKMMPLSETTMLLKQGKANKSLTLRAYVWYKIFNGIIRAKGKSKPFKEINGWVKTTTPEEISQKLIANGIKGKKLKCYTKNYKKRYDFFKFMQTTEWQQDLKLVASNWYVFKKVKNWRAGDLMTVYYKWSKHKIENAIPQSTGHVMMIASNPKKFLELSQTYYTFFVMDSAGSPKDFDKLRIKDDSKGIKDSGIGLGIIKVVVDGDGYVKDIIYRGKKRFRGSSTLAGRLVGAVD